jgi:uncharacterized membrane-anchored protein YhcB (DUF1043 family)
MLTLQLFVGILIGLWIGAPIGFLLNRFLRNCAETDTEGDAA